MKTYFIKFQGETLEEAIDCHGGKDGGYSTLEKAKRDAIDTGDNMPFIILDSNMEVVYEDADYEQ
jgi:hypothetical protein